MLQREICCTECESKLDVHLRLGNRDYPEDQAKVVPGRAQRLLNCNACKQEIPAGQDCFAVTFYHRGEKVPAWEGKYLDLESSRPRKEKPAPPEPAGLGVVCEMETVSERFSATVSVKEYQPGGGRYAEVMLWHRGDPVGKLSYPEMKHFARIAKDDPGKVLRDLAERAPGESFTREDARQLGGLALQTRRALDYLAEGGSIEDWMREEKVRAYARHPDGHLVFQANPLEVARELGPDAPQQERERKRKR